MSGTVAKRACGRRWPALAVAVLATIPTYLIYYAVQPYPGVVVAKQIVFDTIVVVLMGIVCAWINRVRVPAGSAA